jgi:hypothetical protein
MAVRTGGATFAVAFLAVLASALGSAHISCKVITNPTGPDTYVLSGAPKSPFDCIIVENDDPPPSPKEVIADYHLTQDYCNLVKKSKVVSYVASLVPSTTKCRYECRPSQLRCLAPPEAGDKQCACTNTGPRPAIVPLDPADALQLVVQSATTSSLRSSLCDGKKVDSVIGPEVNCQRITQDYPDVSLQPLARNAPLCLMKPHPKKGETHVVMEKMLGSTGVACHFVCRPGGLRCTDGSTPKGGAVCACGDGPLQPRLVAVDASVLSRAVVLQDGTVEYDAEGRCKSLADDGYDSCGKCGTCEGGRCVLAQADLDMKNHCSCGYKCPNAREVEERASSLAGSPIECVPNPLLAREPCGVSAGDGTEKPDLCLENMEADMYDQCVCAPTHREVLAVYSEARHNTCVPYSDSPASNVY